MIPYDMETLRLLNASGIAVPARRFAELEYGRADREWAVGRLAQAAEARPPRRGALLAALAAYFFPR